MVIDVNGHGNIFPSNFAVNLKHLLLIALEKSSLIYFHCFIIIRAAAVVLVPEGIETRLKYLDKQYKSLYKQQTHQTTNRRKREMMTG